MQSMWQKWDEKESTIKRQLVSCTSFCGCKVLLWSETGFIINHKIGIVTVTEVEKCEKKHLNSFCKAQHYTYKELMSTNFKSEHLQDLFVKHTGANMEDLRFRSLPKKGKMSVLYIYANNWYVEL